MKIFWKQYIKLINKYKQYGTIVTINRIIKAVIRPVFWVDKNIVMAIKYHKPYQEQNKYILKITKNIIDEYSSNGKLSKNEANNINNYILEGCKGFIALYDREIAGYAFVQTHGIYTFGYSGSLKIPEKVAILRNLFVFEKFRGKSIGKILNIERINSIPEGYTPVGFVIPENRYAIRNLKYCGFEELMIVKITTIFYKWSRLKIINKKYDILTDNLIKGLSTKY